MGELKIDKNIEEYKRKIQEYENIKKSLEEDFEYKFTTNTAYLLNMGVARIFEGFGHFPDWVRVKHEQHWKNICDSTCEVTFKINKKEVPEVMEK